MEEMKGCEFIKGHIGQLGQNEMFGCSVVVKLGDEGVVLTSELKDSSVRSESRL